MESEKRKSSTIDDYIAASPPEVRPILERIRQIVRDVAPESEELVSYRMPACRLHGILIYYGAFKNHIGLFPPVHGDEKLERALEIYRGEKGNLRFPLDRPIPYELIERIVRLRRKENLAKVARKGVRRRTGT